MDVPSPVNWEKINKELSSCDLLFITAGYEDRSLAFLKGLSREHIQKLSLIHYVKSMKENEEAFAESISILRDSGVDKHVVPIGFENKKLDKFVKDIKTQAFGYDPKIIWADISGLTASGICCLLFAIRSRWPFAAVKLIYTEALDYYPSDKELESLFCTKETNSLETLPPSLSMEISEMIIPDAFSGVPFPKRPTCLVLFAGYEKHRSVGVIESINPSRLVIVYGKPPDPAKGKRLKLSKRLHETLLNDTIRAEEIVSTLDINESIQLLSEYYYYLYDDHNICISPLCSKMQAVATYLFWERYKDVQLVFSLPVHYLPQRASKGVGKVFEVNLPALI
jgi:hypothetical protein